MFLNKFLLFLLCCCWWQLLLLQLFFLHCCFVSFIFSYFFFFTISLLLINLFIRSGWILLTCFSNFFNLNFNVYGWNTNLLDYIQGLTTNVTVNGYNLSAWKMTPIPLTNITRLNSALRKLHALTASHGLSGTELTGTPRGGMAIYQGSFNIPNNSSHPQDTFLRLGGWGKVSVSRYCKL